MSSVEQKEYHRQYYLKNRDRALQACKERHIKNRDKILAEYKKTGRLKHVERTYNITGKEYLLMLDSQENACAVCHSKFTDENLPRVDHDHITGFVRGILCRSCNSGVGMLKDNSETVQASADYLKDREKAFAALEGRITEAADKLDFVLKTFSVSKRYRSPLMPDQEVVETKSLLELYREVKQAGLTLVSPEEATKLAQEDEQVDGSL